MISKNNKMLSLHVLKSFIQKLPKKYKILVTLLLLILILVLNLSSCGYALYEHNHSFDSLFIYGQRCDKNVEFKK